MIELQGKYNTAQVFTDELDNESQAQIIRMMNHTAFENRQVRIMPDVHAGKGSVVGFTSTLGDKIIPNVIGVDIGCGVTLGRIEAKKSWQFDALDKIIRMHIPSGMTVRDDVHKDFKNSYSAIGKSYAEISEDIEKICKKTGQNNDRVLKSLGTLGGGNHYIEIDKGSDDETALSIHSGSRNFGLQVANFHQQKAIAFRESADKALLEGFGKELAWLEGDDAQEYLNDMRVAQKYAVLNRLVMSSVICKEMNWNIDDENYVESIHNYVDFENGYIRKGAISAKAGEQVVVPISMAEGVIFGTGKGNADWNYSAPHGAGRLFSRGKAKETLSMEEYKDRMKDVWSSCVSTKTLDESPMAYKGMDFIVNHIEPTVDIISIMKPVYNFKAS